MSSDSTTDLDQRQKDLIEYIRSGRILDAMREFYAPDTVMIEGNGTATRGLEANLAREQLFLESVKDWKGFEATAVGRGDGVTFLEAVLEYTSVEDQEVRLEQVSVQHWRDGRIVQERFYYDTGG